MSAERSVNLKSPARRLVALLVCRLYAVLPCIITPLLAGVLAASGHGVIGGGAVVLFCFLMMSALFPDFLERKGAMVFNALFYFAVVTLPALVIPATGAFGFFWGLGLGSLLTVLVVVFAPRIPPLGRILQAELFPDVLTGLLLTVFLFIPIRLLRGRISDSAARTPPFDVAVIVCAYEEEATIDESLRTIKEAVARVSNSPLCRRARIVLVDSSPDDTTRRRLVSKVDRVIDGDAGKLSARHQAILAEACDIVVAADADRRYDPEWLVALLAPFADPAVVAAHGETRNAGSGMSASALCRAALKLPYNGGNSAFLRSAYLASPFTISLDQRRHKELWLEEEFLFGLTLQAQGEVVHVRDCRSYELRPYPLFAQLSRHLFGVRLRTF